MLSLRSSSTTRNDRSGDTGQESSDSKRESGDVAEILVTAQKRLERLQDVPVPMTVISSTSLLASNQTRIQDYYATIPGLNLANDEPARSSFAKLSPGMVA